MVKEQVKKVIERLREKNRKIIERIKRTKIPIKVKVIKSELIKENNNLPKIKLLGIKSGLKTITTGIYKKTEVKPEIESELKRIKKLDKIVYKKIPINKLQALLNARKIIKASKGKKELFEAFVKENQLKEVKEFIKNPKKAIEFSQKLNKIINYPTIKYSTWHLRKEIEKTINVFESILKK